MQLVMTLVPPVTSALSPSDEEREEADSEQDEGIHIPGKFRQHRTEVMSDEFSSQTIKSCNHHQVAASLPVGIPWPAQLTASRGADRQRDTRARGQRSEAGETDTEKPSDIAASIQVSVNIEQIVVSAQTRVNQTRSTYTYRLWQKVSTQALFLETMCLVICPVPE